MAGVKSPKTKALRRWAERPPPQGNRTFCCWTPRHVLKGGQTVPLRATNPFETPILALFFSVAFAV